MIESNIQKENNSKIVHELSESWLESGIEKGDTVLLHSSLSRYVKDYRSKGINISPLDILNSFLKVLSETGTLILPVFNFGFAKGLTFDIRNSKSETGVLTETARLHPDSIRTPHPLFSFAVLGYNKKTFSNLINYSAFGPDSPFAKLLELNGKIAALDIAGENCMTFYHHVEEMENAPNRYHKIFKGNYIDIGGIETEREFDVYSRNIEIGVVTDVKPMEDYLWSKGLYSGYQPGKGNCLHVIKAETVYEEASKFIREKRSLGILYKINSKNCKIS